MTSQNNKETWEEWSNVVNAERQWNILEGESKSMFYILIIRFVVAFCPCLFKGGWNETKKKGNNLLSNEMEISFFFKLSFLQKEVIY